MLLFTKVRLQGSRFQFCVYVRLAGFIMWKAALLFVGCFVALNLLYVIFLGMTALFVNTSKPLTKQNPLCRVGAIGLCALATGYSLVRTHVTGQEKLPKDSRFLMVCNHRSMFDPLVTIDKLRDYNLAFISKPENMAIPIAGRVAYGAGFLPVDRVNNRKALSSINTAADYLRRGMCSMVVYPEGTRSKSGKLLPFHAGSFKIAQKAPAPLVIAAVRGTERVAKSIIRGGAEVYLDILEVVSVERVRAMSTVELAEYSRGLIDESLKAVKC